ncbi:MULTISPECIES: hypothetical protein [Streptomyces]|uniref:hypothetical protein n=1 Tax=Streptomyces TaxID=1883 RepID=UPI00140DD1FB|nr:MULTISPECIES: hypothetical protein [Streptomyces]
MGWTYDFSDAARDRRSAGGPGGRRRGAPQPPATELGVGIGGILRRRARWVSVRLRQQRP